MNLSNRLVKSISAATLTLGLILSVVSNISYATTAPFEAKDFCKSGSTNCVKEDKSGTQGTISCPEGKIIDKVYVHAGDGQTVYELPETGFSVVYTNGGRTATVTVTTFPHNLSWLGLTCTTATTPTSTPTNTPTPTDTPTVTPTDTPTETPTPTPFACPTGQVDNGQHICVYIDCPGGGTCEVVIGSPTPTATPTATETPTPTQSTSTNTGSSTVQSATGSNNSSSSSNNSSSTPAMANTGSFSSLLSNASMLVGMVLSTIALPGYAKKKKK